MWSDIVDSSLAAMGNTGHKTAIGTSDAERDSLGLWGASIMYANHMDGKATVSIG